MSGSLDQTGTPAKNRVEQYVSGWSAQQELGLPLRPLSRETLAVNTNDLGA
jgi:hypothetical protein